MIPNPIVKVHSTLSCHEVRHLLMGGQACVFYGAAEFSRDCDIVVLSDETSFARLQLALDELSGHAWKARLKINRLLRTTHALDQGFQSRRSIPSKILGGGGIDLDPTNNLVSLDAVFL